MSFVDNPRLTDQGKAVLGVLSSRFEGRQNVPVVEVVHCLQEIGTDNALLHIFYWGGDKLMEMVNGFRLVPGLTPAIQDTLFIRR